jgi:hypothetical protein
MHTVMEKNSGRTVTLPKHWRWTREPKSLGLATLFYARDSRWPETVPDVVETSADKLAAYACECNQAECICGPERPADHWSNCPCCEALAQDGAE